MSPQVADAAASIARPTMQDVARLAGVSVKTVSRVVNGEPGVRDDTQGRVSAAIAELGFLRNDGASQLRSGRTDIVGLIVEDLANPFYSAVAASVERVARRHGHLLMTASGEGLASQERSLESAFLSRRVAGMLVVPTESDHTWLTQEAACRTPVVFLDRPAAGVAADTFLTDNEGGVRSAVEHLVALGHRHIAFLGDDPGFWTAGRRLEGFRASMEALGLPADRVAMAPHDRAGLVESLRAWSSGPDGVTAVITGNNIVTVAAVRAMRQAGLALGLVGFDDFELADLLDPAVTVVAQDPALMGEQAAHLLFERLAGAPAPPRTVVLPTRLVVRESGRVGVPERG